MSSAAIGSFVAYLLFLVVLIPGILGWGFLFGRAIGSKEHTVFTVSEHGFLGILAYGIVGLCVNFFWPLTTTVALAVLLIGYVIFAYSRKKFNRVFQSRSEIVAFISLLAFMSLVRAHSSFQNDVGLYHLPAIVWGHESSVPLGLANLHSRFGFNSLWPVISSAFWLPWFELKGVFSSNALITFFFFFGLLQWMLKKGSIEGLLPSRLFALLVVLFLIFVGVRFVSVGSPANDWPAGCLTLYAFFLGLRMSETPVDSALFLQQWCLLLLISILTIMIKLSQLPVALLPVYFAALYLKGNHKYRHRGITITISLATVASLLWMSRGLLLSGCLLYPWAPSCNQALPWSVPIGRVINVADEIKAFAKQPGMSPGVVLADWSWLGDWINRFLFGPEHKIAYAYSNQALIAILVIGVATCIAAWVKGRLRFTENRQSMLWIIALMGVLFWFFSAPVERFGYGFLISLALLPIVIGLNSFDIRKVLFGRAPRVTAIGLIIVLSICSLIGLILSPWRKSDAYSRWAVFPTIPVIERINFSGQTVRVPMDGNGKCWDTQPPCTPYFDPAVTMVRSSGYLMFQVKR